MAADESNGIVGSHVLYLVQPNDEVERPRGAALLRVVIQRFSFVDDVNREEP
jgi:hypothetical protein